MATHHRVGPIAALILLAVSLGGCGSFNQFGSTAMLSDRECLARVMYFESNRSSDEGMLAVGTVVMNRLQSPKYPKTVCGVIGQSNQFAEGALTKPVLRRSSSWTRAEKTADAVLGGERHAGVRDGKFFHTAGYTFPYRNMHYLTLAGGNAFYEKKTPGTFTPGLPWENRTMVADARPTRAAEPTQVATRAERAPPVQLASADEDDEVAAPAPAPRARPAAIRPEPDERTRSDDEDEAPAPRRARSVVAAAPLDPIPRRPGAPATFLPGYGGGTTAIVRRPVQIAAAPPPPMSRAVIASAAPPARPKPIVVAMLSEPRGRPAHSPRSIEDLIEMDLHQR